MTDSEFVRSQLAEAAQLADEAVHLIRQQEGHKIEDVGIAINKARADIKETVTSILEAISKIQQAMSTANVVLIGSSDINAAEAMAMLENAEFEQSNMVVALQGLHVALTDVMLNVQGSAVRDKDNNAAQVAAAAAKLRAIRA